MLSIGIVFCDKDGNEVLTEIKSYEDSIYFDE